MEGRVEASVIWEELRRLVRSGSTGTLFLTSEDNTAGRIGVKAGVVVFLAFKFSAGRAALPLLQAVRSASFRFEPKAPGPLPNMPSTEEILAALGVDGGPGAPAPSASPPAVTTSGGPPRTSSSMAVPAAPSGSLRAASMPPPRTGSVPPSQGVKSELGRLLAEYMGPIAPLVFEEHWSNGEQKGMSLDAIIDALAKELGGPRAAEFRAKAIAKIR